MEKVSKKDLELLEYAKSKGLTKKELEQLFLHRTKEPGKEVKLGDGRRRHALIGVIGDSHLGSKACDYEGLHKYYKICKDRGVEAVFHAGDLCDGLNVYKGHVFELSKHSADEQIHDIVDNYPNNGLETYFIGGNHDESWLQLGGYDILKAIDSLRADMHSLGWYNARIKFNGIDIELHHGGGGSSYAKSYKLQKYLENVDPKDQPTIYALGHFHDVVYCFYRKIHAFMVGGFQKETNLSKRLKLGNTRGGWIIDITVDKDGGTMIHMEFIAV